MCIRDSISTNNNDDKVLEGLVYDLVNENNSNPEKANKRCDCLLYTSDAADERSSVDLGGRRIIKKNN